MKPTKPALLPFLFDGEKDENGGDDDGDQPDWPEAADSGAESDDS